MMAVNSIVTMPLRSFSGFTGGLVSESSVDGLVDIFNKKKGGFRKFLKGFKNPRNLKDNNINNNLYKIRKAPIFSVLLKAPQVQYLRGLFNNK